MNSRLCGRLRAAAGLLGVLTFLLALLSTFTDRVIAPAYAAPVKLGSSDCTSALKYPLPLPSTLKQPAYQNYDVTLYDFLNCGNYLHLGWARDKGVRDTGPFLYNVAYGTHPTVRIFYSPQIIAWLKGGRKGNIPDGAMIIKEQYKPPAQRFDNMTEAELEAAFAANGKDWTVMIRDARGSKDGWYWAEVYSGMSPDATAAYQFPFAYPNGGFGHYCINCHGSAKNGHTFAALNNVKGFPGEPLTFRVDNSWRTAPAAQQPVAVHEHKKQEFMALSAGDLPPVTQANPAFLETYKWIRETPFNKVQTMVPETLDRVVSGHNGPEEFLSSDQCLGCHGAVSGYNPVMFLPTVPLPSNGLGVNVSPYGEWRWSPMGLAGRDPIFYAQLESELAYTKALPDKKTAKALSDVTVDTCFRCHGVMGKRQWNIDTKCEPTNPVHPCNPANPARPQFQEDFTQLSASANPHFKYGALARDGVSCLACHRQQPTQQPPGEHQNNLKYFLENSITGLFQTGPRSSLIGPFKDVMTLPMKNALGITPRQNDYIKDSRVCGTCHSIYLPVIDTPPVQPVGPKTPYSMEQATYLEWLNSKFQTELPPVAACSLVPPGNGAPPPQVCAQSCQDCHMPGGYHNKELKLDVPQVQTQIAVIEDQTFPAADARAATKDIEVKYRENGFVRHELLGMNVFLLEMFKQFNNVLGVRTTDFMSGSKTGIEQTIDSFMMQARERTARIETNVVSVDAGKLVADVKVTNLAGHRLPSGVGFRRAFIEFMVLDTSMGNPRLVWASGRTNDLGVIVDGEGKVLPSEFFEDYVDKDGKKRQRFQPHFQLIDAQNQVQIYEELTQDADDRITTSFLRRDHEFKDNRLLPAGWTRAGPDPKNFAGVYLEATYPKGEALNDPDYADGSGTDTVRYSVTLPSGLNPANLSVRATLNYQSIPPYFLAMRFKEAPDGPGTQRLFYLTSNLDLSKSPVKGWKLRIAAAEQPAVK